MADEKSPRTDCPALKILDGGRRALEEELLREFLHPGTNNLERVQEIARVLKPRGSLRLVGDSGNRRH